MIVRTLESVVGTDRETVAETWTSRRLLLRRDGLGFSLHDTLVRAGTETTMWYRHHIEAVYCIDGTGELADHETGETHPLGPGTLYVLDGHERHTVRATTDLRMICVFDPPVTGRETHGDDGSFPLLAEDDTDRSGAAES